MRISSGFFLTCCGLIAAPGCWAKIADPTAQSTQRENRQSESAEPEIEGDKMVKVKGTITLDGRSLEGATIMFLPVKATVGRPASGITDEKGTFDLSTRSPGDGVFPGEYVVTVSDAQAATSKTNSNTQAPRIPEKFATPQASPLRETVSPESKIIVIQLKH